MDLEPVADMLSEIDTALSSLKDVSERLQELHDSSCDGRTVSTQQNLDNSSHSALGCALSEIAMEIQHYRGQISYLSERIRRVGQLVRSDRVGSVTIHAEAMVTDHGPSRAF